MTSRECEVYSKIGSGEPKTVLFNGYDCHLDSIEGKPGSLVKLYDTYMGRDRLSSFVKAPHHTLYLGNEPSKGQIVRDDPRYEDRVRDSVRYVARMDKYPFGNDRADWFQVKERMPWSEWKVKACTGKEPGIDPYTPQSSMCDNVMTQYCNSNPSDPQCSCLKSEIPLAGCFDIKCINTNAYKTKSLRDQSLNCPTYMDCRQYLTLDKGATDNVVHSNYLNQTCIAPDGAGGTRTEERNTGGYTPVGGGDPVYSPISTPSGPPPVPAPYSSESSYSDGGLSTTMLIVIIVIVALVFIAVMGVLIFGGDETPARRPRYGPAPRPPSPQYEPY